LTKDGFPTRLIYLKPMIDSKDPIKIRGVLTLLSYNRSIQPTKDELKKLEVDYSTINSPYKGKDYTIPLSFIQKFVVHFQLKSSLPKYSNQLHYISSKGSAFGKATLTASYAIYEMTKRHTHMLTHFTKMLGMEEYMEVIGSHLVRLYNNPAMMSCRVYCNQQLGKLSIVNDPELKFRVIAMLDYYSQFILKPIHGILMDLLRKFPQDRTYTQDPFNK